MARMRAGAAERMAGRIVARRGERVLGLLAVAGVAGFVDVPIVHLSVTWWRSLHQRGKVLSFAPQMAPVMSWTLVLSLVAFTLLYAYLVTFRLRVGRLEDRAVAEALSPRLGLPI